MIKAYHQGQIDYFCGIYAIINATRIATGAIPRFTYKQSCAFYQHLIQYLYDNNKFLDVLYHGTSLNLMDELLAETQKYLFDTYGIHFHYKKILSYKRMSISQLGNYISAYTNRPNTSCIVRTHSVEMGDHWTVAIGKKSTILGLFDSYFYKQIDLAQSTLRPYKRDNLNHIVRQGVILIKVLK
ncbi:MAG: hypothetical protein ACLRFM_04105 [Alphaproteobacteria bacterium]